MKYEDQPVVPERWRPTASVSFDPAYGLDVDGLLEKANPALLDKRLLSRFYSSALLASARARSGWVEPDREPFPWMTLE